MPTRKSVRPAMTVKLASRLDRWFVDRQVLIRGTDRVVAIKISKNQQLAGVFGLATLGLWLAASSLGLALSVGQAARMAATDHALARQIAASTAAVKQVLAENAVLAAQRNQAVTQAGKLRDDAVAAAVKSRDEAVAAADLARDEAEAQAALIGAANRAALGQLAGQTEAEIGQVNAIIRSTGMDPGRLLQAPGPAADERIRPAGGAPDATVDQGDLNDELLDDLNRLEGLGGLLGQMPLAAPVGKISVTSPFGYRPDPWTGAREFHVGVDLRGPIGTPVFATAPGIVAFAGVSTGYGNLVTIDHGYGLETRYSHLDKILVHVGAPVGLHQEIGLLGNTGWSTGPHLLYETRVDGAPQNPLNFIKVSAENVQK